MKQRGMIKPVTALMLMVVLSFFAAALPSPVSACWQTGGACDLSVPTGTVTMTVRVNEFDSCDTIDSDSAYFVTTLSNVPAGTDIVNGNYNGWCVDLFGFLIDNRYGALPYTVNLYSSLAADLPANLQSLPLNEINYILNIDTLVTTWNPPAAPPTWLDKQAAIWSLLYSDCHVDSATGLFVCPNEGRTLGIPFTPFPYGPDDKGCPDAVNQATIDDILAAVSANGANFIPTPGQKVAVLVQPQPPIFPESQCNPGGPYYEYCEQAAGKPMQLNIIEATCHTGKCIKIEKLVSVDGGKTFQSSEDCCKAPVATTGSVEYKLVVTNCGGEDLTDVTINDPQLGISNYPVGSLLAGQSVILTQSDIPKLFVAAVACGTSCQFDNTATVTGTSVIDGSTTSASDSACVKCPASPPPPKCTANSSSSSKFSCTPISSGSYIWFNANLTAGGVPSTGAEVDFTASTIAFTDSGGTNYSLPVPPGKIIFSPSAGCSSTTFDGSTWVTTVPISNGGPIFLAGLSFQVPAGVTIPANTNVTWTGTFGASSSLSIKWQWGAAEYSSFSTDYDSLGVKPAGSNVCGVFNSDRAGTPEAFKSYLTGGVTAGCTSSCTGSWGSYYYNCTGSWGGYYSNCTGSCGGSSNYTGSLSCSVTPNFTCQYSCSYCGGYQCGWYGSGCSGSYQCGSQQCGSWYGGSSCSWQYPSNYQYGSQYYQSSYKYDYGWYGSGW